MTTTYKFPRLGSGSAPIAYQRRRSSLDSDGTEGSNSTTYSHCDSLCPLAMPHSMPTQTHPGPPSEILECEFFSNEAELRQRSDELFHKNEMQRIEEIETIHPLASKVAVPVTENSRRMGQFRFTPPEIVVVESDWPQGMARFNAVRRLSRRVRKRSHSLPPDSMPPVPPVLVPRARGISFPQTSGWYESSDEEAEMMMMMEEPPATPTKSSRMRSIFGRFHHSTKGE
jgi:hypothetical protein